MATHQGRKKGLGRDYKGFMQDGPGGWHCPCCNPYHCHPNRMKPLAHRQVRRAIKQAVKNGAFED